MRIELWEKVIERHHCPSNREIHHTIKSIKKRFIAFYTSESIPREGEVISMNMRDYANQDYIVHKVIRDVRMEEKIILEVSIYDIRSYYCSGSDSWFEEIPLVTDIEYEIR